MFGIVDYNKQTMGTDEDMKHSVDTVEDYEKKIDITDDI
jgi:hypothetical protein